MDDIEYEFLQVTNDTLHYFMYGESPLDEENMGEISELLLLYPQGFEIIDVIERIPNSDLVDIAINPVRAGENVACDFSIDVMNHAKLKGVFKENGMVEAWFSKTGGYKLPLGILEIKYNKAGCRYITTPKGSTIFI